MIKHKILVWLFEQSRSHFFLLKILGRCLQIQNKKIKDLWHDRVIEIQPFVPRPNGVTKKIHPIDFFNILDETSQDVVNINKCTSEWLAAKFTNKCTTNQCSTNPTQLSVICSNSGIRIIGQPHPENWAYLVSKQRLPDNYSIEFDFMSHSVVREHIQICFHADSLCQRFRYILRSNELLYFDIVDYATFFQPFVEKPFSIPLHRWCHIRLDVLKNKSRIIFDGNNQMAIRVKKSKFTPSYFMLLFWNAETNNIIDVELKNLKITL